MCALQKNGLLVGLSQKLYTIFCTLDEPLLFQKSPHLLPFMNILANAIKNIYYKSSVFPFIE